MFDCPEQYHTSPKLTRSITAGVEFVHPVHVAVTLNPVPAFCGATHAFHSEVPSNRTVMAAVTASVTGPLGPDTCTATDVPPVPMTPYKHALAGA
jgi:hypothetical protein